MKISRFAKIVTLGGLGMLLVILAYSLILSLMFNTPPFHPNPYNTLSFNRQDWLADRSCMDGSNRRGHMAYDLVGRHLSPGIAEAQVKAILGPPDHVHTQTEIQHHLDKEKRAGERDLYFQQRDLQAFKIDDYYLGEELSMGWGIDRAWLYLYIDQQGRYTGYRIEAP